MQIHGEERTFLGRRAAYEEASGAWVTSIERIWLGAMHRGNDLPAVERFAGRFPGERVLSVAFGTEKSK